LRIELTFTGISFLAVLPLSKTVQPLVTKISFHLHTTAIF